MLTFDLLYRAIIDYDEVYCPENEKNVDNFSFFVTRMKMLIPILFESMKESKNYFFDNEKVIDFSVENKKELFELFEDNRSKIINVVIVQEIGTLNVLALIYKSDDIELYRKIIEDLIETNKIYDLFCKKEERLLPTFGKEINCDCEKCECGYIENTAG